MRRVVGAMVIVVALALAVLGSASLQQQGLLDLTGLASNGSVFLCINEPPTIDTSACPLILNQSTRLVDNTATCMIGVTDADNESVEFEAASTLPEWFWIGEHSGNLSLRPFQDHVGTQIINITATDPSGCANGEVTSPLNLTVLDINDPPELIEDVEDVEFTRGTSLAPYSLFEFFDDPDNDPLNFSVLGASIVSVSITQGSGMVYYSSTSCGTDYLLFRATDPGTLFAESGIVEVTSVCETEDPDEGGSSGSGGGSSFSCTPKWQCRKWSECYINGTREKECVDLNGCSKEYLRTFWENCTYVPSCYDGVQNQGETGVDCGGPCRPCGTCFDGIMNNDEEDVDCGGEFCEPCQDCSDGVMNWGEVGVDCGGPCEPCASCFDGVQNQGETAIDCGGPCPDCSITETPGVMAQKSPLTLVIMVLSALLIALLLLFRFYRQQIMKALARLGLYLTRKKRKQVILAPAEKVALLTLLREHKEALRSMQRPATGIVDDLTGLSRRFFSSALGLVGAFTAEEVRAKAALVKDEPFRKALVSFFSATQSYERSQDKITYSSADLFLEELRLVILLSSAVVPEDLSFEATEKEVSGTTQERCVALLHNILIALQFEEPQAAKEHYLALVSRYESLSERQKAEFYAPLMRAYHEIKYELSWT